MASLNNTDPPSAFRVSRDTRHFFWSASDQAKAASQSAMDKGSDNFHACTVRGQVIALGLDIIIVCLQNFALRSSLQPNLIASTVQLRSSRTSKSVVWVKDQQHKKHKHY